MEGGLRGGRGRAPHRRRRQRVPAVQAACAHLACLLTPPWPAPTDRAGHLWVVRDCGAGVLWSGHHRIPGLWRRRQLGCAGCVLHRKRASGAGRRRAAAGSCSRRCHAAVGGLGGARGARGAWRAWPPAHAAPRASREARSAEARGAGQAAARAAPARRADPRTGAFAAAGRRRAAQHEAAGGRDGGGAPLCGAARGGGLAGARVRAGGPRAEGLRLGDTRASADRSAHAPAGGPRA